MKTSWITPFITGILVATVAFVVHWILGDWGIRSSSSSTAAIGYLFLPFTSIIGSIPFFAFGFCAHYAVVKLRQRARIGYFFATVAGVLATLFIGISIYNVTLWTAVDRVRTMPQAQHEAFLQDSFWRTNKYVLGALLEHPELSAESLYRIATIPSPDLHQRFYALPPIMGKNTRGLAVMRLVVLHPNVDERALIELAKSPDLYVQGQVAGNSKTPEEILRHFYTMPSRNYLIDWGLAENPNTPADILHELAKSHNEYTRRSAERNLGTVEEDLEE
ncbi:MAG: hypothetical protein FWG73_05435 [Planctomycetaceae bacterium]|nr:hypothetical protein [Planctomycetaceae bacterium]